MKLAEKFFDRLIAAGDDIVSNQRKAILSSYRLELVNTLHRVSEIKNLVYRSKAAKLSDIFVEPSLSHDDNKFTADDVFQRFLGGTRIIIRGSAGLGKSVLLKHFCLCHVQQGLDIAPLFLELRKLDGDAAGDLVLALHETYNGGPNGSSLEELKQALGIRSFSLLLDGFDEVSPDNRDKVERAILRFVSQYPSCPVIVSGRSDRTFLSWEHFDVYDIEPMSLKTTVALISKLKVNSKLKNKFINDVIPNLFNNTNKSFVQTPLLAILMLLTYETFGEVPEKMHLFYASAFETLLRDHDLTKSQFRRPLKSKIPEEDFKKVFSSFCAATYAKRKFEFNFDDMESFVKRSFISNSVKAGIRPFIDDLVLSVCVMQYESLEYSFVHRSFQEYFTAVFLRNSPIATVDRFLKTSFHPSRENVIPMLISMDRDRIEKEWCLPAIELLSEKISGSNNDEKAYSVLKNIWIDYELGVSGENLGSVRPPTSATYSDYSVLEIIYPAKNRALWWFGGWTECQAILKKTIEGLNEGWLTSAQVVVVVVDKPEEDEEGDILSGHYTLQLSTMTADQMKRIGILDFGKKYLIAFESDKDQVSKRVSLRDDFAGSLFD